LPSNRRSGVEDLVERLASATGPVDRLEVYHHLRNAVHEDRSRAVPAELNRFAAALPDGALSKDEDRLGIHARTAMRLLEADAPTSAWLTILHEVTRQPTVTIVCGGAAYAWLPGFRDPRVGVPDWIYEITDRIILRCAVEDVRWEGETCVIGGWAHFSHLATNPDEMVTLVLSRLDDGRELRVSAHRQRRPDRVKSAGAELTRLAWAGFRANVPGQLITSRGDCWKLAIELERDGLVRRMALARAAGTILDRSLPFTLRRQADSVLIAGWDVGGRLELKQVSRLSQIQAYPRRARRRALVFGRRVVHLCVARCRRWVLRGPRTRQIARRLMRNSMAARLQHKLTRLRN
jgi:hypothetical protein